MKITLDADKVLQFMQAERLFNDKRTQFLQYLTQVLEKSAVSCEKEAK